MHHSHKHQLRRASHPAILHTKELFVTGPEWFIVSSSYPVLLYAHSPRHSQSQARELRSYFYLLPSPILTSSSPPYHTASSNSLKIWCRCALRSRSSNSFCTSSLDGTILLQHRKTLDFPASELTAHPLFVHSSTPVPHFRVLSKNRDENREVTPPPPIWRACAKPTGCLTTRPSLASSTQSSAKNVSKT
jgi:hypothetical protein